MKRHPKKTNVSMETIDLNTCDHTLQVSNFTVPMEQVHPPGTGTFIERGAVRINLQSEKYGSRILEGVIGSTRQEKLEPTFMDMETWAAVKVVFS